jgi:quercetin dioxygenase-like cupin family protein
MHQSYSDRQPGGRWRFAGMVGLAVLACLLVAPATAWANSQQTTLARSGGVQLPAGDLIVRVLDLTVPADQPAVTHMHGAGFTYAVAGAHVFTAGGNETVLAPGQAAWIGAQESHGHGARAGATSHFWFILVGPAASRGTPPTWPYTPARIAGESASFRPAEAGARDLVLTAIQLARPGDTVGPLGQHGPVGVALLEGQVSGGGQALQAGVPVLQQPGDTATFTNTGAGAARLLALYVLPPGRAPGMPATGAGGGAPPTAAWLAPALLTGGLLAGLVVRRRRAAR